MAKPNQLKDAKPKEELEETKKEKRPLIDSANVKILAANILTTTLICTLFLVASYIMQSGLLTKKLSLITSTIQSQQEGENTEISEDEMQRGVIIDLGDFTMNLSDVNARRYLKANVAIEISKTAEDLAAENAPVASGGGGHGGHGAPAATVNPMEKIEAEMAQYKPAIRDIIISCLSSKTSDELSTTTGKELAKEEITEGVNAIFGGEREIIRVSFGQFIMQ